MFRLISNENQETSIEKINTVNISLELPKNEQVLRLFRDDSKGVILSFGDNDICSKLDSAAEKKDIKIQQCRHWMKRRI